MALGTSNFSVTEALPRQSLIASASACQTLSHLEWPHARLPSGSVHLLAQRPHVLAPLSWSALTQQPYSHVCVRACVCVCVCV